MQHSDFDDPAPAQLFDAGAMVRRLWRRRRTVLFTAAAVLSLAVVYVLVTRPSYTATASILVDPRDVKTTNIDTVLPGIGADSAAIASQVSVIQSRELLGKVFDSLELKGDPEYASQGLTGSLLGALRPSPPAGAEAAFQKFSGTVSVEREGLTYVLDVGVKSTDPAKAARIANAVVNAYIASTAAQQTAATAGVTEALKGKIASLQADVSNAERAVEDFKRANNIFDETTGGTLTAQVDALSGQVLAARDALAQAETKYDQAAKAGTSPEALLQLSDVWSSPAMENLRTDYNTRAAALASAQATLGPKHPTVVQAKAELARVQNLLAREAKRIAAELKSDRDLAQANLDKAQKALAAARAESSRSDMAQVELRQLQRQADAARTVLNDFMQRSQETSQIEGLQNQQVHVISQAVPPADPTWPKPLLLLPVSLALGLMLGSAVALLTRERAGRPAPAPAPAPAPVSPKGPPRDRQRPARPARGEESGARRLAGLDQARSDLVTGRDSPVSRTIRRLLGDLIPALPAGGGPYVLAFSSGVDPALAMAGADLTAAGLRQIGGRAVFLAERESGNADACDFIVVTMSHPLAAEADCRIEVTTPGESAPRTGSPGLTLVLDLDRAATRPRLVLPDAGPPVRAAL